MAAPVSSLRPTIMAQASEGGAEAPQASADKGNRVVPEVHQCTQRINDALEEIVASLKARRLGGAQADGLVTGLAKTLGSLADILRSCPPAPAPEAQGAQPASESSDDSTKYVPIIIPILFGSEPVRNAAIQMIDRALQNLSRGATVFLSGASRFSAGFSSVLLPLSLIPEGSLDADLGLWEGSAGDSKGIY